jgi:hypothetical protein
VKDWSDELKTAAAAIDAVRRPVVIRLDEPWATCSICGEDTPSRWGVPRHNGDLVSNDWPGEWAASPACQRCHNAHAAGLLVTCDHLYAAHGACSGECECAAGAMRVTREIPADEAAAMDDICGQAACETDR